MDIILGNMRRLKVHRIGHPEFAACKSHRLVAHLLGAKKKSLRSAQDHKMLQIYMCIYIYIERERDYMYMMILIDVDIC